MPRVYGANPVVELLRAQPQAVERIYLAEGAKPRELDRVLRLAREAKVQVERVKRSRIDALSGGGVHQGIVAELAEASLPYAHPDELVAKAKEAGETPLLLALDQVQDPIHLGASLRSAQAFGAHGLVIPKDRAVGLTPAAIKASAGAAARLRVARATNLVRSLEQLKEAGLWVIGADMEGEPCDAVDLGDPICLVVGGEGKGLRPLTRERCDRLVAIPMEGEGANSLSASAAASILLYEVSRQRRAGGRAKGSGQL